MERYYQRSRLSKKEENIAYKKIFLAVFSTVLLSLFIIFLGIPALINMAMFISGLKGEGDLPVNNQSQIVSAPTLESPYEATNTAKIKLTGYGSPGYRLEIFKNGDSYKKFLVPTDGSFDIENVILNKGKNEFWAISENENKERSERSNVLTISYLKEPPKIEITEPEDNAEVSNDTKTVKISGKTENAQSLTINDRVAILDADGNFSYDLALNDGDNTIIIIAKDLAGNEIKVERKVVYRAP